MSVANPKIEKIKEIIEKLKAEIRSKAPETKLNDEDLFPLPLETFLNHLPKRGVILDFDLTLTNFFSEQTPEAGLLDLKSSSEQTRKAKVQDRINRFYVKHNMRRPALMTVIIRELLAQGHFLGIASKNTGEFTAELTSDGRYEPDFNAELSEIETRFKERGFTEDKIQPLVLQYQPVVMKLYKSELLKLLQIYDERLSGLEEEYGDDKEFIESTIAIYKELFVELSQKLDSLLTYPRSYARRLLTFLNGPEYIRTILAIGLPSLQIDLNQIPIISFNPDERLPADLKRHILRVGGSGKTAHIFGDPEDYVSEICYIPPCVGLIELFNKSAKRPIDKFDPKSLDDLERIYLVDDSATNCNEASKRGLKAFHAPVVNEEYEDGSGKNKDQYLVDLIHLARLTPKHLEEALQLAEKVKAELELEKDETFKTSSHYKMAVENATDEINLIKQIISLMPGIEKNRKNDDEFLKYQHILRNLLDIKNRLEKDLLEKKQREDKPSDASSGTHPDQKPVTGMHVQFQGSSGRTKAEAEAQAQAEEAKDSKQENKQVVSTS